jgi:hypothetical protein
MLVIIHWALDLSQGHLQGGGWPLPSWGFKCLLNIVNLYKTQTGGPVRAHPRPYEFAISHQKAVTRVTLGVDQAPHLPPKGRPIIRTRVITNLMSSAPKLVPEPFQVPLCDRNLPPQFSKREAPSPQINTSSGA